MTLDEVKTVSEIFSNFMLPIAAFAALWGAKEVAEKVIEARGAGVTARAEPPTGTAAATSTSAASSAPQAIVTVTPDKK